MRSTPLPSFKKTKIETYSDRCLPLCVNWCFTLTAFNTLSLFCTLFTPSSLPMIPMVVHKSWVFCLCSLTISPSYSLNSNSSIMSSSPGTHFSFDLFILLVRLSLSFFTFNLLAFLFPNFQTDLFSALLMSLLNASFFSLY